MRFVILIFVTLLLTGCSLIPGLKMPESWKNLGGSNTAAAVVGAQKNQQGVNDIVDADKKVEEARKKIELEYAKFREDLQKAYDDRTKKDNDNFAKISELNYGVYHVTQEKKKVDINTTIAHLRSKEIMMRADKLTEEQKEKIKDEIEEEKKKTVDELYVKYKASIDLAISQKAALDAAEQLIVQKEKEKAALREANKQNIERLEKERNEEIEKVKKKAADELAAAKEAQKQEYLGYMIKALVGVGILSLIAAGLLKSINLGIIAISSFALAYTIATAPAWVIGTVVGVAVVSMVGVTVLTNLKKKQTVQSPQ